MRCGRLVPAGSTVCLAVGLLLLAGSALAASPRPTKHCPGTVAASKSGVTLGGSDFSVTATAYNATKVQNRPIWPALSCRRAHNLVRAYLSAKLTRPLKQCTVPALRGTGCKVGQWVCYSPNTSAQTAARGSYEQACLHVWSYPHGPVRRLTTISFRETDQDNG